MVIAALTLVIAIFTVLVFLVYERMEWLTGAMESHSALMLRIEAQKEAIPVIWWDPSEGNPPLECNHNDPAELNCIYVYVPPKHRRIKPKLWNRMVRLFD